MRFPDNARVCFVGDSMTAGNGVMTRVATCYKNTYPDSHIRFFNCGVSGGNIRYALKRLDDDTLIHNPTHAVVAFGINDSRISSILTSDMSEQEKSEKLETAFADYKENLKTLCDRLTQFGAKVTVCAPPPYDEFADSDTVSWTGGYAVMKKYAEYVCDFAKANSYALVNYNKALTEQMPTQTVYELDRVHPNMLGAYYMAKAILDSHGLNIGEYAEYDPCTAEWRALVSKHRQIQAVEYMIVQEKATDITEKLKIVEEYSPTADSEYMKKISLTYLECKRDEEEILKQIYKTFDKDILKL